MSTQLAERGKEKISLGQALELVKEFAKKRYKEDRSNRDRALAHARDLAGGQVERLDKDVVDQGRQWATRLAMISRTTAGSGYQTSKSSVAIAAACKKVFGIIGELEALAATDTEIPLFAQIQEEEYFGDHYSDIRKTTVKSLSEWFGPGESVGLDQLLDQVTMDVGSGVSEGIREFLAQYEIEPIIVPDEPEGVKPAKNSRRGRRS